MLVREEYGVTKPKFKEPFERLSNVNGAKLIEVLEVKSIVGEGDSEGTPIRPIVEYFSKDGVLLARRDSYLDGELEHGVWSK